MIKILPFNETYVKVMIEDFGVEQEFSEFFTFFAQGYKYAPKFRSGQWDGKIRMFNSRNKTIYKGLIDVMIQFAKINSYQLEIDQSLRNIDPDFHLDEFIGFVDGLTICKDKKPIKPRSYQIDAAAHALWSFRSILISPTGSGKSLIMYLIIRYLQAIQSDQKVLIVVPSTMLVNQLFGDFDEYSYRDEWSAEENIQTLYSGKDKVFSKNLMITTWQSLHAMKKNNPELFVAIVEKTTTAIFDEAHVYKATEVLSTLELFSNTKRRTGTTGTLDGSKVHELALRGIMGPIFNVTSTRKLIDDGSLSDIKVKILKLQYPEHIRKGMKGVDYKTEIDFLVGDASRNKFITQLTKSCKGTTMVMFSYVDRHGMVMYEQIKAAVGDSRPVYFVYGKTDEESREEVRKLANTQENAIMVVSEKLFSTGVNIPRIQHIIMTMPRKSSNLIRQIIGRGVRLFEGKTHVTFYDLVDDMSSGRKRNPTLELSDERLAIYIKEEFEYKTLPVDLARFAPEIL